MALPTIKIRFISADLTFWYSDEFRCTSGMLILLIVLSYKETAIHLIRFIIILNKLYYI